MNKTVLFISFLLVAIFIPAQEQGKGGIGPELLAELENSFQLDGHARFAINALAQVDASKIAVSQEKLKSVDAYFSLRLKEQKITDQKATGRCWMFAGLNILRPLAAKALNVETFEFSQSYLFFYDKLEKANLFLEAIIATRDRPFSDRTVEFLLRDPVPDGGWWSGLVELIGKYGLVPAEVMPESQSSNNSTTLNRTLGLKLKEYALRLRGEADPEARRAFKTVALKDVYKILAFNFGPPPRTFTWRFQDKNKKTVAAKTYTPQQFYREAVNADLDNYHAIYSVPTRPFGRRYQIDLDRPLYDGPNWSFVNCPIETLKELARTSLLDNRPVWFACDVGRETLSDRGLMVPDILDFASIYGMDFRLDRRALFETYSNFPNHAMVFTGLDLVDNTVKKWLVENSWGEKFGNQGYYYMLDEWFGYYVQAVIIHKKYLPAKILDLLQTDAEIIPPWDPIYRSVTLP